MKCKTLLNKGMFNQHMKKISISLKIVSGLLIAWIFGSLFAINQRYESGLPLFGFWVTGIVASLTVLVLDIIGPISFLVGLKLRKSWAPKVAYTYIGIFIANSLVALFTHREYLGFTSIFMPAFVNGLFLILIYKNRIYFKK